MFKKLEELFIMKKCLCYESDKVASESVAIKLTYFLWKITWISSLFMAWKFFMQEKVGLWVWVCVWGGSGGGEDICADMSFY